VPPPPEPDPRPPDPLRRETAVAVDAVGRALDLARTGTGDIHFKIGRDVVTDTDVAVEDLIRQVVDQHLGLPVVGEEGGGERPTSGPYWLVDPICGTRNFASGIPLFAVNMALVEEGEIVAAVVGDGSTGDVSVAERTKGAWAISGHARRPLHVDGRSRVVALDGWPPSGPERRAAATYAMAALMDDRWDFRSLGTTLSLAYLASGRIAGSIHFGFQALHAGAGALLADEAGAMVTDGHGHPWHLQSASLVAAADAELHRELIDGFRST
jgi:myo-inositol-1(or 4)-monophosphatase